MRIAEVHIEGYRCLQSLTVKLDDYTALVGTNGSGKSILLKMIAGMESIDSGDRSVNPGSKIVYLPQQPDLDENNQYRSQNPFLTHLEHPLYEPPV